MYLGVWLVVAIEFYVYSCIYISVLLKLKIYKLLTNLYLLQMNIFP
jgi:hypothetical protein